MNHKKMLKIFIVNNIKSFQADILDFVSVQLKKGVILSQAQWILVKAAKEKKLKKGRLKMYCLCWSPASIWWILKVLLKTDF